MNECIPLKIALRRDGNSVDLMNVFIVLLDFMDYLLSIFCLIVGTLVFSPTREKYKKRLQYVLQTFGERHLQANYYQNDFDFVISENEVFEDPLTTEAVKD